MIKFNKKILVAMTMGTLVLSMTGCDTEGPAERAGREMDEAAQKAGQQIEEAREKIQEAVKDAQE